VIAFSTSPNETASDIGDTGGPYARALASELVVSGQDQLRLFQNVKRRVYGLTGKRQQPWESYGIVGEIFLGGEASKSTTVSLPKPDEVSPPVAADQQAKYTETDKTRVSSFSWISPPGEFKPGIRKWTRISSDRWQEEYPDGTKNISLIRKRINVGGCDGSVISGPLEEDFQGFIPDKGCLNMTFLFRRLPTRKWTSYVPLTNIR
jgi:hypothetical protein